MDGEKYVYLQCIVVNGRLRVRIISNNYFQNLNVQFPRGLRIKNQIYRVPATHVGLISNRFRDYYFVKRQGIELIEGSDKEYKVKLFTEEGDDTCCICLTEKKYYVYVFCGHFYVCKACHDHGDFKKCPICRSIIVNAIPYDEFRK